MAIVVYMNTSSPLPANESISGRTNLRDGSRQMETNHGTNDNISYDKHPSCRAD